MTDNEAPSTSPGLPPLPPFDVEDAPPELQEALRRMSQRGPVVDMGTGAVVAEAGRLVTDRAVPDECVARVQRIYDGHAGLYVPSVVAAAAALLDAYLVTAEQRGLDRADADYDGWLAMSAAETVSRQYGRPKVERTAADLSRLLSELRTALTAEGLTVVPTPVRMGIGVDPLPEGPRWGSRGGLAVALYSNTGWELMVNSERATGFTIHAPATAAGAAEVAALVHGLLRGDVPDPFRRPR
ncbi:hypothetical protein [Streptomyces sp. SP17KL33]|uniref:hypothetical protein n=1 Tax=Streptomyces sp. SP17KL33 TaxID=3002534 RepID=UPI002E78D9E7|nr:hypothetical protein [Streptomyces sp. SP17KL33]MEE1838096.1 hypothetical protein [Streptomyces sp. SP17KL33]